MAGKGTAPSPLAPTLLGVNDKANYGLARLGVLDEAQATAKLDALEADLHDMQERIAAAPSEIQNADEGVLGPMGEPLPNQAANSGVLTMPQQVEPVTDREIIAWKARAYDFLHNELKVRADLMPQREQDMIDRGRDIASRLSAPVQLSADADPAAQDAVARIQDLGYKLVHGADIGHSHIGANPLVVMDGALTHTRKIAEGMGISPDLVANSSLGAHTFSDALTRIQKGIEDGNIHVVGGADAGTIMALLQREGYVDTGNRIKSSIAHMTGAVTDADVAEKVANMRGTVTGMSEAQLERAARAELENELNGVFMPADLPRTKVTAALQDGAKLQEQAPALAEHTVGMARLKAETNLVDSSGNPVTIPGRLDPEEAVRRAESLGVVTDQRSAEYVFDAIRAAQAAPGWYQLGASKLDYLFRRSMGFAGKSTLGRTAAGAVIGGAAGAIVNPSDVAKGDFHNVIVGGTSGAVLAGTGGLGFYHGGGDALGWAMANMPNRYKQIVNNARFTLSPYFSVRRVAKSAAKMVLNGIPATFMPLHSLQNSGELDDATAFLRKIRPGWVIEKSCIRDTHASCNSSRLISRP